MIRKMLVVFPHELVPELARLGMLPEVNAQGFWEHAQSTGVEWAVITPAPDVTESSQLEANLANTGKSWQALQVAEDALAMFLQALA
ncbi:hypothetical protein AK812_SmicGene15727 [Symbiodinium microadriaticum]|uniref:Uncharacterized protein n=1 Tax=Symbiodinium microadriaticum TaxID=2951 RepID=A0A1Q9E262_SYMMI|nr:hypothetical protein AK812_SmicGene15727 [Symbiodinium microadriaticum]